MAALSKGAAMNVLDIRRFEMLVRVRDFGEAHHDVFPAQSLAGPMFAALAAAIAELNQQAASEISGRGAAREGTASKSVARVEMRQRLEAISQTARAMALDTPGLGDKFRLPRGRGDQRLLTTARAFAQDAEPFVEAFVAHAMLPTFLTDLRAEIDRFEQAMREHSTGRETHIAARAAIDAAIEKGLTAVQHLDAIVLNQFRQDPSTLAVWASSRHVEYPGGRTTTPAPTPLPPTPAPSPSTA
jgi:hypothetical protein